MRIRVVYILENIARYDAELCHVLFVNRSVYLFKIRKYVYSKDFFMYVLWKRKKEKGNCATSQLIFII
jgi:hypothetical protein